MSIGVRSENAMFGNLTRINPEQYAQKYARENNLSIEEARAELKSKYGDPQEQQSSTGAGGNYSNLDIFEKMDLLNQADMNYNPEAQNQNDSQHQNIFELFKQLIGSFAPDNRVDTESQVQGSNRPNTSFNSNQQGQDPDKYAQKYMKEYNEQNPDDTITLEEAKKILEEKYGKPDEK